MKKLNLDSRTLYRALFFVALCLFIQQAPIGFAELVKQNISPQRTTPNTIEVALTSLPPGMYYVSLGVAWTNWEILLGENRIGASNSPTPKLNGALDFGAGFSISEPAEKRSLIIRTSSPEAWRGLFKNRIIVTTYRLGRLIQAWRLFNLAILGPLASAILILLVISNLRLSFGERRHLLGLLAIGFAGLLQGISLGGYVESVVDLSAATAFQLIARCLFSAAFVFLFGTYSTQSRLLLSAHLLFTLLSVIGLSTHPEHFVLIYKLCLGLSFLGCVISVVRCITQLDIEKNPDKHILVEFGIAQSLILGVASTLYIVNGPSSFTIITPATISVLCIVGMRLAYNEIVSDKVASHLLRYKLESAKRFNTMAAEVAHDIRSPVSALATIAKGLEKKGHEEYPILIEAVARIESIANGLLNEYRTRKDVIRQDTAATHTECIRYVSYKEFIELVRVEIRAKQLEQTPGKSVQIELFTSPVEDTSSLMMLEPARLSRCLSNLLNNAIEASAHESMIDVIVAHAGNRLLLSIKDNGAGIPEDVMKRVGEPGFTYNKKDGTGLGLASAKASVNKWVGELVLESTPNQGTTVTLAFVIKGDRSDAYGR
ncbi:MAG: sensor histidine kinase [Deltaproteobacteria bacterium]|nr:sensor histidine kinase [Deltaproteobacteria bacterium]